MAPTRRSGRGGNVERLSASDSWYLYLQTSTVHMHVTGIAVVDPAAAPEPLTFERLRDHVAGRLHLVPEFRRRLVRVPFGIDHPAWAEDPELDLDEHLHRHVVRRSHDRALDDFAGRYCSEPLDRRRPLWDMVWVEGLPQGRAALVTKLHHSLVDGVAGVGLLGHLLDISPRPVEPGRPARRTRASVPPVPGPATAIRDAVLARLADPLRPARAALRVGHSAAGLTGATIGTGGDRPPVTPLSTPRTPFNATLTSRRAVATGRASLDDVRTVARARDVAVNEVVLAACTTSLRRVLRRAGAPTDRPLVCSVPVTMRRRREPGVGPTGRHRTSPANLLVPLPVHLEDPLRQLEEVHRGVAAAGRVQSAIGAGTVGDVAELVPPPALSWGASWWSRLRLADRVPPAHNLVVSSVPGSPVPLFLAGAPVTAMFPLGPLAEGVGLNVTVMSDRDALDVGVVACPDLVPDVSAVVSGILDGVSLLVEATAGGEVDLTGGGPRTTRRPTTRRRARN